MDRSALRAVTPQARPFEDGLGVRRQISDQSTQAALEMLCVHRALTAVPSFESSVRERVSRLANFRHASYGRVRRIDRLTEPGSVLGIVSEGTRGTRLSEILGTAERHKLALDVNAALFLVQQLTSAVATLHQNARDVAHGAIALERIVVTSHAQLIVTDYVFGSALEELHYSYERYWKDFRIALPRSAGGPRFDHRADVTQIGIVALCLILGRPLTDDECPHRIANLVATTRVAPALRTWLSRALQIDRRAAFGSTRELQAGLDTVLSSGSGYVAAPVALDAFLERYQACGEAPASPAVPHASVARHLAGFERVPRPQPSPARPAVPGVKAVMASPPVMTPPVMTHGPAAHVVTPLADPVVRAERSRLPRPAPPAAPHVEAVDREDVTDADVAPVRGARVGGWRRAAVIATIVITVAGVGIVAASRYYRSPTPIGASIGTLVVESSPSGAQVIVDGEGRGVTPVELSLRPGPHVLELHGGGEPRVIPLTVTAGAQVSQYIELPQAASTPGALRVRTDPAGAQIRIDGRPRGISPLTIGDLAPGEHEVALENDRGSVTQTVTIEAGATASLVVPLTTAMFAPVSGWVTLTAPVEVQLFERGALLGTSAADRIMLAAGVHDLELVNDTLGYRQVRSVEVVPGETLHVAVELPDGTLALNASPWAEVWVDGERVGETPLGNLPVSIGPHEVLFRHPDLGERRHAVTVTAIEPARLSVDLSRP